MHWRSIAIAVVCWLFALQQVRMYLIYTGRIYSPTIGAIEGGPTLRSIALRSAFAFAVYGFLVMFVSWPRRLTCVGLFWLFRAAIEAAFVCFGRAGHGVVSTDQGRRQSLLSHAVAVLIRAVLVLVLVYFFGF